MVGKECLCALCRKRLEAWPVCLCVVDGASNGVPNGITSQIRGRDEVQKPLHLGGIIHPFGVFACTCHGDGLSFLDDKIALPDIEPMAKTQKVDARHALDFTRHGGAASCGYGFFVHWIERGFKHISGQ